jgi:Holliday junction resolvasome RuvABC ATP-dependent DNA helicase subunit
VTDTATNDNVKTKPAIVGQTELKFFGPGTDNGKGSPIKPPKAEDINILLDRENPDGPFFGYIGNNEAVEKLCDVMYEALLKPNHNAGPNGIALIGPASTGKTTLAKMVGIKGLHLPFVECDRSVKNTTDLLERLMDALEQAGVPLIPLDNGSIKRYKCPPCVIYFDEAHAIKGDWLLKATERKDTTLITSGAVCDCRNVLWIMSTTHRGKLPKAFDSRFTKVMLYSYSLAEVATMVKNENYDLPNEVCRLIANYSGRIPREALDFASEVKLAALRKGGKYSWEDVCKYVGERNGVNEDGITRQQQLLLAALFNNRSTGITRECVPLATKRAADQVGVEEVDLEEFILPPLQMNSVDRQPLVRTTSKGLELTDEGVKSLTRWGMIQVKQKTASGDSFTADFYNEVGIAARSTSK